MKFTAEEFEREAKACEMVANVFGTPKAEADRLQLLAAALRIAARVMQPGFIEKAMVPKWGLTDLQVAARARDYERYIRTALTSKDEQEEE